MAGYCCFMLVVCVSIHLSILVVLLSVCDTSVLPSIFLFLDDNLNKCQWIFTKLSMYVDIVEIWFVIADGQISLILDRVICLFSCCPSVHLHFCLLMIIWLNVNEFLPNLVCALIL